LAASPKLDLRREKGDKSNHGGLRLKGYLKKSFPDSPLITIVTVVLNQPSDLKKTIASILEQTYDNIEYIIIDGASSDSTIDVIKSNDDKIDFWISEPDKGIFDAMNKGIDLASGEWINFMNAGDYFYQNDTVKTVFNKDYGNADFIYGHTQFLGGDFNGVVKAWDFKILWKTMVFTHQSLFTKSEILKTRKFDTRFKICADYDIIFNSYMQGLTFFNSDIVIAAFDPGFSDVSRARMAYEKWKVVKKHRKDFQFHWFYLQLFFNRLFRDISKRMARFKKQQNQAIFK
jgi:glycosyltransferase involved in cell wall biosynthesis